MTLNKQIILAYFGLTTIKETKEKIEKLKEIHSYNLKWHLFDLCMDIGYYHIKYDIQQKEYEEGFKYSFLNKINILFWDEFSQVSCIPEGKNLYVCIKNRMIPDKECYKIFSLLIKKINALNVFRELTKEDIKFFDHSLLSGSEIIDFKDKNLKRNDSSLYKEWRLHLDNMQDETLKKIIDTIQNPFEFNGVPVHLFSPSDYLENIIDQKININTTPEEIIEYTIKIKANNLSKHLPIFKKIKTIYQLAQLKDDIKYQLISYENSILKQQGIPFQEQDEDGCNFKISLFRFLRVEADRVRDLRYIWREGKMILDEKGTLSFDLHKYIEENLD